MVLPLFIYFFPSHGLFRGLLLAEVIKWAVGRRRKSSVVIVLHKRHISLVLVYNFSLTPVEDYWQLFYKVFKHTNAGKKKKQESSLVPRNNYLTP